MFFQRKKKRLLRELWRRKLPSLPLHSDYYASCLRTPSACPASRRHPVAGQPAGVLCWPADEESTPSKELNRRRRSRTSTSDQGGFCLGQCCGDVHSTCSSSAGSAVSAENQHQAPVDEEAEEKAFLAFLGKTLAQRQLETLLASVSACPGTNSTCVLIRRQEAANWGEDLAVLACRMWRWSDLDMRTDGLKRIPSCPNDRDPVYICCNPSHWFRVLQPELPPPPYSATFMDHQQSTAQITDYGRRLSSPTTLMDLKEESATATEKNRQSGVPDDDDDDNDLDELPEYSECGRGGAPNHHHHHHQRRRNRFANCGRVDGSPVRPRRDGGDSSWSTFGEVDRTEEWCSLAYWEQATRVGAVTKVERATVNVVCGNAAAEDVCLAGLAATMPKLGVNPTRSKIGAGIMISHEGDSMWLYNRSTQPVFVHSLTICDVDSYLGNSSLIMKLYPGYCMRAYNPRARMDRYTAMMQEMALGPVDVHSVRISFTKGWGQTYKRQDIKSCPCWLEVILNPCHFSSVGS